MIELEPGAHGTPATLRRDERALPAIALATRLASRAQESRAGAARRVALRMEARGFRGRSVAANLPR